MHGDYHVSSGSPVIDAGDSTHADLPATDVDGDPRVVGVAVDIGADEAAPDLCASTKSAPAFAAPGQTITYTILMRNDGALSIAGARLNDTLPALATYTSGSLSASAGSAGAANGVITWTGALSVSAPVKVTFAVTTSSGLPDSILTNTAVITHPLLDARQSMTVTTALYRVNLYTSQKTVAPDRVVPGESLTYTLIISNTGIDLASAQLTDTLPTGLTVAPASLTTDVGEAGVSGQTITWTGTLGPEVVAHVQFCASTDPEGLDDASVTNIATLSDGVHPPFEIVAPSVVVGFHKVFLPFVSQNYFPPILDDFSDPSSGWPEVENPANRYEYLSGEYRIYNKTDVYEGFASVDHQLEDLDISVTGRRVGSARGGYGILFGTNETASERFVFIVWPDYGEWDFLHYQAPAGYETITWGTSEAVNPGTGSNRLRIVRQGNSVNFWVNGVQVYSSTHTTYTGPRYVGLYATPLDAGHDARFDDYELRLP